MNRNVRQIPPHKLLSTLRGHKLLPMIVFLPARRACDESASAIAFDRSFKFDDEKREQRIELFQQLAEEFPEIRRHKHAKLLVDLGVASHHAGHIPSWKITVEKMMSAGLLDAIFATSTVAAGVDFPARTVVLSNADTRGNDGWRPLSANELQQMTGRAGRRGRDNVGFVILVPGQFQNPKKIAELLKAKPDPLVSQFRATYTTLLNLLDAFGSFEQVREIVSKSFAFYDRSATKGGKLLRTVDSVWGPFERLAEVLDRYDYIDYGSESVSETGKWLADLRIDRPLLVGEAIKRGIFDEMAIQQFAAVIAAVTADAERNYGESRPRGMLDVSLYEFEKVAHEISESEWDAGIDPKNELNGSAAVAAEMWASERSWQDLVKATAAEEGDLMRLLSRTGEALHQIAHLGSSKPELAAKAREAAQLILRAPVR